jgi:predicted ATP-dependent endonuclease of OLD family
MAIHIQPLRGWVSICDKAQKQPLPCAIKQLYLENYQGIIKTSLSEIPLDSQWLFLTGENNKQAQNEISEKSTTTYSLFNVDGILLNIEYELLIWYLKRNPKYEIVKAVLLKLLPSITDIQITDNNEVVYLEHETSQNVYQPLPFQKLAAGYKSIIAMYGDMLIRFYQQQPEVIDPKDFCGIALIDELELHFHPKIQRQLPILLSAVFPKIQFIVSRKSVIPFLGAPAH